MQNVNSPLPVADLKGTGMCPRERGPLISTGDTIRLTGFLEPRDVPIGRARHIKVGGFDVRRRRRPAAETSLFKWCIFHADGRVSRARGRGFAMRAGAALNESL